MEKLLTGYRLLEGPAYEPSTDTLLFADAVNGGVYRLLGPDKVETVVPGRKGIGGMALHAGGGVVVSGKNIAVKSAEHSAYYCELPEKMNRFNDLTVDPIGRVYAGSLYVDLSNLDFDAFPPGFLHLIDLDGSTRIVADDVRTANGLGFSPDGGTLYFAQTGRRGVVAYDVDRHGDTHRPRTLREWEDGLVDGLAVAEDGSVLVALSEAGRIAVVAPDGTEQGSIEVPHPRVTSLAFGGIDLRTLYITTGTDAETGMPGSLFRTEAPVKGLPVPEARISLNPSNS